jgi:hypothetical protein
LNLAGDQELETNQLFRSLVTLHIRITLLSDVTATAGIAHGRAASTLLQIMTSPGSPEIMADLGALHRASIWENILMTTAMISTGIDVLSTPSVSPLERSPERGAVPLPEADGVTPNGVASGVLDSTPSRSDQPKQDGPRENNAKALKHLAHGLPSSLAPFFQGNVLPPLWFFLSSSLPHSYREDVLRKAQSRPIAEEANIRYCKCDRQNHHQASHRGGLRYAYHSLYNANHAQIGRV